jgi:hypothetical protein
MTEYFLEVHAMKRRNFLKSSLGMAGLLTIGGSSGLMQSAMAADLTTDLSLDLSDLVKIDETVANDFTQGKHRIKIMRRGYRHRLKNDRTEKWVMNLDGKDLSERKFRRHDAQGCFHSELLPFETGCNGPELAAKLVNGLDLKLFGI